MNKAPICLNVDQILDLFPKIQKQLAEISWPKYVLVIDATEPPKNKQEMPLRKTKPKKLIHGSTKKSKAL